ncbi:L-dopachrome tautomerase-related protein [Superficieibacter sp. HKU1]|uniref:L-dopachrome tautomerase-related protein n=1 Tax=Superficieibacter sp. HKU1 TaxID=3031919 RepID=UPI0023E16E90|nr:L-dopachrome tautomerase-related protein [Superficieibacter sp. HKU1]WES67633.1 L-dopachrome tautomerase-related protein [Superficieibacter sp. HKU1]
MTYSRRTFLKVLAVLCAGRIPFTHAVTLKPVLQVAVQSPWMANQVAITRSGRLFLGLPRYSAEYATPSLARQRADGSLQPFPGNRWNTWQPGDDGSEAFVYLNSVHVFTDESVWCVDQGSLSAGIFGEQFARPGPGAQKIVQLDAGSGEIIRILRFDETILPPGAQMNDLRFHGSRIYISDSGLGGIIIHDLKNGLTLRRLSGMPVVKASDKAPPAMLAHVKGGKTFHPPNSDMIEITADGTWLYWAAPTGPLYRVQTEYLWNEKLSDTALAGHVELVYDNNFSGGCAMDSEGNIYFSETETHNITLWSPHGKSAVLVSDPRLVRPDGSFISPDRKLWIPVKQPVVSTSDTGKAKRVFNIYSIDLPNNYEGIPLGSAVSGS